MNTAILFEMNLSKCCDEPIEELDQETQDYNAQHGIESPSDYGIYTCPKCCTECEAYRD